MANPLYGSNQVDNDMDLYGRGLRQVISVAAGVHQQLTADETGALVVLAANSTEVTLPAAAAGLNFQFIFSAHATAACRVNTSAADDFVGSLNANTGAGDIAVDGDVSIDTGSATVAGDYVSVVSDGTDWFIVDSMSSATTNGLVMA
jgi:hypothetical protein